MKKIFIAFLLLAALILNVVPSKALVGMPDAVPGTDILQSFFIVKKSGGLDTLLIIQEVGGLGGAGTTTDPTTGVVSFVIYDRSSVHRGNFKKTYTHYDLVGVSVRELINTYVSSSDLHDLEYTLGGVTYYVGYIYWTNTVGGAIPTKDNLIAKQYLVGLTNGWASGVNMTVKEYAPASEGYVTAQNDTNNMEALSAQALATSDYREHHDSAAPTTTVTSFRLMSHWYLYDANASNFIFIWKSFNKGTTEATDNWEVGIISYDTAENGVSIGIKIDKELNIIDVREEVPPTQIASYPAAGWFDIRIPNSFTNWNTCEFDAYSWQFSKNVSHNWAVLFAVHREAGTFSES